MACVKGRKRDLERGQVKRAKQQLRISMEVVLDRLSKLGAQFWSARDCLRTVHWQERMRLRGITYREFLDTWRHGEWLPDPENPEGFIAALGRCRIVVIFREEVPHLVTAKYVAAHEAI
jgi:hypothetical protein